MSDTPPPEPRKTPSRDLSRYAQASATAIIDRVHPVLLAIGSVLAVCIAFGGFAVWVLSSASAQTTQQIDPISAKQAMVLADLAAQKVDSGEFRAFVIRKLERQDEKMELVLDALRVPLSKRPMGDAGP